MSDKQIINDERAKNLLARCYICYMEIDSESCVGCEIRDQLIERVGDKAKNKVAPYQWFL